MSKAVMHFGNRKTDHMHYVGLSRIRRLDDVYILELNEKKISVYMHVVQEMKRLRTNCLLHSCVPILSDIREDLKIVYHNSRSLHLHFPEFARETNIHASDIIAISESRLKETDKNDDYEIQGFNMHRFDDLNVGNTRRSYRGIVVYSKLDLFEVKRLFLCKNVEAVLAFFCHNDQIHQVVFLYCCPTGTCFCN